MASPICTVDAVSTASGAVDVAASTTVTIALADTAGVTQWNLTCLTTDGLNTAVAINSALSINLVNKTATFNVPATLGSAFIFQSKVNDGLDINGVLNAAYTTTFKINVLTSSGLPVTAFDEKMEQHISFGWMEILNNMIRQYTALSTSSGAGLTGFYNVGQNADNSIVVNANDIQLRLSYQALLDGATAAATADKLALRNGSAGCSFAALVATTLAASASVTVGTTLGVTGATTLSSTLAAGASTLASLAVTGAATVGTTLGVTGATTLSSTLAVTTSVTSPSYLFTSQITGITEYSHDAKISISGGVNKFDILNHYYECLSNDITGLLFYWIKPPNGSRVTSVSVKVEGATGHTFPIEFPTSFAFLRYRNSDGFQEALIGSISDPNITAGTYEVKHDLSISSLTEIINNSTKSYLLQIGTERGVNSMIGLRTYSVSYTYDRLAGSSVGQD